MKRMTNKEIAGHLEETGILYAMWGTAWKPAAYERAAAAVADFGEDIFALYKKSGEKALTGIPSVGPGIAEHIASLLKTGTFPEYVRLRKKAPVDVLGLSAIEGIGPRTILRLWEKFGIKDLKGLRAAAESGKLKHEPRMAKVEAALIQTTGPQTGGRKLLGHVLPLTEKMLARIRATPGVRHADVGGSVRRRQETIGDLDFIVTADDPEKAMDAFVALPQVAETLERGRLRTMVRLVNGMHADLLAVKDASYGGALHHFTGSRDHNIELRKIAVKKGMKMNEFGLWKGKKLIASRTEKDLYEALGLPWIPPEIRTREGEIEAALSGTLPDLIPYDAVRGDLQVQTDWTDGAASMEAMVLAAKKLGREYLAITDHTKALAFIHGLDEKRVAEQGREIDKLRRKIKGIGILKGTECDILRDGALDIRDATLKSLDIVGVSVHSHFRLSRSEQTERVVRAMRNPHVDVFFHPTGRKIGKREPIDLDMNAVVKAARDTGTALEIDSYPDRSDLRDEHVRMAVKAGVKLVINTDAHHPKHLEYLDLGVGIARRGWASKKDVLNTRKLPDLMKWLQTSKKRRK